MFKTYFCKLVLGFSPRSEPTTAEMFSLAGVYNNIEKKLKFQLPFAKGRNERSKEVGQFT